MWRIQHRDDARAQRRRQQPHRAQGQKAGLHPFGWLGAPWPPKMPAWRSSTCNLQTRTQAEASSMTLSTPNATRSRLCAIMPEPIATAPSMTIQAMESHSSQKAWRMTTARSPGSATVGIGPSPISLCSLECRLPKRHLSRSLDFQVEGTWTGSRKAIEDDLIGRSRTNIAPIEDWS